MRQGILIFLSLICAFNFLNCIEEFYPKIPDTDNNFLIVEGQITDKAEPYFVKLSRSLPINATDESPVSGANVQIEEEGAVYLLTDQGGGLYSTNEFTGQPDHDYRLSITLDGNQYQSSWQTLRKSSEIDSIYYRVDMEETEDPDVDIRGIQWYVDSHGEASGARLYRYEWDETWQIGVNWPTFYYYLGNDLTELIPAEERRNTCWMNSPNSEINLTSTALLSDNVVSEHPLFFTRDQEEKLTIKYSVIVRQYALDEEEHEFWRTLRESNVEGGNLFDKQPASVVGNVKNVSRPDETVLGYFSANGVKEQRKFVIRRELPNGFGFPKRCALDTILKADQMDYEGYVSKEINRGLLLYNLILSPFGPAVIGALLAEPQCADCVIKGGNEQIPDFWE
ncbi:MAG: DUF4249 domain-containing protein [Bacteroidetes bacterium]|nr:DUF4249 domain-containing protein [Bacteroidota bacterium]MDA1120597.1 DUF4249 domain-containing protein [Bacteroidota bacterium]